MHYAFFFNRIGYIRDEYDPIPHMEDLTSSSFRSIGAEAWKVIDDFYGKSKKWHSFIICEIKFETKWVSDVWHFGDFIVKS